MIFLIFSKNGVNWKRWKNGQKVDKMEKIEKLTKSKTFKNEKLIERKWKNEEKYKYKKKWELFFLKMGKIKEKNFEN